MKMLSRCASAALLVSAALLPACRVSPTGKFLGVSVGEQRWHIVQTPHFTLRIEAIKAEAQAVAVELESSYQLLADLGFPMDKDPGLHSGVVIFRTQEEYERVGPAGSSGYFASGFGPWDAFGSTFVCYGGISQSTRRVVLHELTHRFVHYVFPQAPIWLHEGLAQYYETVVLRDGKAELGLGPRRLTRTADASSLSVDLLPDTSALMAMDAQAFYAARSVPKEASDTDVGEEAARKQGHNYASAWALVQGLKNGAPRDAEQLQAWLEKMAAGKPAQAAFDEAFAGRDLAELDAARLAAANAWADHRATVMRTDYEVRRDSPPEARELSPAEVEIVRGFALLMGATRKDFPELKERARAALEADPTLPEAHLLEARYRALQYDDLGELEELRAAVKVGPDSEVAAKALFSVLSKSQREGAHEEAEALLSSWLPRAKTASLLNNLAWYMVLHGRVEEAIPLSRKSVKLDPSCHECFDTAAFALLRTGELRGAIEVEEIAAGLAGERPPAATYFKIIGLYRAANTAVVLWKKRPEPGTDPSVLPPSVIEAIVAAQKPGMDACSRLGKASSPSGAVLVTAAIGEDGKVTEARLVPPEEWSALQKPPTEPPLKDEAVIRCAVEQIRLARFPPSSAPSQFTYTISLHPSSGLL
ncbi:MAG: hypothetical protein R3B70_33845 [Polyangiaceae bacterium]